MIRRAGPGNFRKVACRLGRDAEAEETGDGP
jgi:hypothetical protein